MQGPEEPREAASSSPELLQPAPTAALQLVPQEQGGASLLQLVAAWDRLASRLPPQAGGGHAADVILSALKLAVAYAPPPPAGTADAAGAPLTSQVARALSLASRLADLAAEGLPIDAESIAAGILAEVLLAGQPHTAASWRVPDSSSSSGGGGELTLGVIEERMGPIVAQLVHDVQRARQLPARVELLDDTAASALRELCLAFYDVRATAVEVVSRLEPADQVRGGAGGARRGTGLLCRILPARRPHGLALTRARLAPCSPGALPPYERHVFALEALQMYAPMGHALGLSAVASQLEDGCFQVLAGAGRWAGGRQRQHKTAGRRQAAAHPCRHAPPAPRPPHPPPPSHQILFPESYERTAAWLREEAVANADVLAACKAALAAAVAAHPRFAQLAAGVQVHGRTKTLFSTLKKLLRLGNTAAGGRARAQLYDLMGLRAVVQPRTDLPADEAEELAAQACYLVREAAAGLWECVEGRSKDYIAAPKPNGYQSLHSTMR